MRQAEPKKIKKMPKIRNRMVMPQALQLMSPHAYSEEDCGIFLSNYIVIKMKLHFVS